MNSLVIYASRTGNTRRVAEAIADTLRTHGPTDVCAAEDAPVVIPPEVDLLVIGGPTEGHGATPAITQLLARLAAASLSDRLAAAFDTRLRWPLWLSGSAGAHIADRLREAGAIVVMPQESFFVTRKAELEDGELGRARAWGAALMAAMEEQAIPV